MNKTPHLLGRRFSKEFMLNRRKVRSPKWTPCNLQTASHEACPICRATDAKLIAEVDRVGFPSDTVICDQCGFVFNDSYIADPAKFYRQEWASERWVEPEESFRRRSAADSYAWKRLAFLVQTLGKEAYDRIETVLEVGCGDGCNLLPHHLVGKQVTGCDFDDRFLQPGCNRGMELLQGDINAVAPERGYDLVMLIHSYEHVIDLQDTIEQVRLRLNEGGMVYVEVPGLLNWNRTRTQSQRDMGLESSNNFLNYLQMQHNYNFDLSHLSFLWKQAGFNRIYGDEWVRAVFAGCYDEASGDIVAGDELWDQQHSDVLRHLQQVERDFLSPMNLLCKGIQTVTKKFCNK